MHFMLDHTRVMDVTDYENNSRVLLKTVSVTEKNIRSSFQREA